MGTQQLSPAERDGALARLGVWRTVIAVAGAVGVAVFGVVAAATIPGHAQASNGAAQLSDPRAAQPQPPDGGAGGGLQPPAEGPGSGFGGGQAVSGGS